MTEIEHDSFWGGLNLIRRSSTKAVYEIGERPPYPIIIGDPTVHQIVANWNLADTGIVGMFATTGFFVALG